MFNPRSLVDLAAAVSSALLMNEGQWVGIVVKPINYPLKGAVLHVDTGPGLSIEQAHGIEIERYENGSPNAADFGQLEESVDCESRDSAEAKRLTLQDGKIELPDWASNVTSILWIPVRAVGESLARGTQAGLGILMYYKWYVFYYIFSSHTS